MDPKARGLRALVACGADAADLSSDLAARAGSTGWGAYDGTAANALDSALALGALHDAGATPSNAGALLEEILARRHSATASGDEGWSGDFVLDDNATSDRTITAEVLRAIAPLADVDVTEGAGTGPLKDSSGVQQALVFIAGAPGTYAGVETLEIAARLAAIRAWGWSEDPNEAYGQSSLEAELLARADPNSGVWSDTDVLVNALGLLALTTKPGAVFDQESDIDGDGVDNDQDAFPYDARYTADKDADGIPDLIDDDKDGDGYLNAEDDFEDDPTRHSATDDADDDDDGISDLDELAAGTDPLLADTDGDGVNDDSDACPLDPEGSVDADGDGVCAPTDACDDDPDEVSDLDGDLECDGEDDDIDGDGILNVDELVAGSDPYDALSIPAALDPTADYDGDGLANGAETVTSPFRRDTDGDGASDGYELGAGTDPTDPASSPIAVLAVLSTVGTAQLADLTPVSTPLVGDVQSTTTGGQPTPVAPVDANGQITGGAAVNLSGFMPQTLAVDADGDGLSGLSEIAQGTSPSMVDTDGDGFVDGYSGWVSKADSYPSGFSLSPDGSVAGELTLGTDPADAQSAPGLEDSGDVAPLGFPDGEVNVADAMICLRLAEDPALLDSLARRNCTLTREARCGIWGTTTRAPRPLRSRG